MEATDLAERFRSKANRATEEAEVRGEREKTEERQRRESGETERRNKEKQESRRERRRLEAPEPVVWRDVINTAGRLLTYAHLFPLPPFSMPPLLPVSPCSLPVLS